MKRLKPTRETIRTLATLDLTRVRGGVLTGDTTSDPYTAATNCAASCVSFDNNCSVACPTRGVTCG